MENIETAILLMVVGMATVFVILLIVIYLGPVALYHQNTCYIVAGIFFVLPAKQFPQ